MTVAGLVLFHGHACDGLVRGGWAMRALADLDFGAAPLERSDLLVVSRNSPCFGDVAAYLTGGRAGYSTHRLHDALGVGSQIQMRSTGACFEVREEPGFFPEWIAAWEAALLGDLDEVAKRELLAVHETVQWDWVRQALLPSAPADHYRARRLEHLDLPAALAEVRRTDTVNRSVGPPVEATSPTPPTSTPQTPSRPTPARGRSATRRAPAEPTGPVGHAARVRPPHR